MLFVAVMGCGNPNGTVKVSGNVTVDGQAPPGPGVITFSVVEAAEGFPNRPTMAKFKSDGVYEATTFDPGDGLLPGTYTVAIECYETPHNMEGKPVRSYIPKKYMSPETSGFKLTVEPKSKPVVYNLELSDD